MTIPKEALDAAAKAIYEVRDDPYDLGEWDEDLDAEDKERYECDARAALEAALPHLREQIARDVERSGKDSPPIAWIYYEDAARIVRGKQ